MRISRSMMVGSILVAGMLFAIATSFTATGADAPQPKAPPAAVERDQELKELMHAFRGVCDVYLTVKGAEEPAFTAAEILNIVRVGDASYYDIRLKDGGSVRVPPSQILMVKFSKK